MVCPQEFLHAQHLHPSRAVQSNFVSPLTLAKIRTLFSAFALAAIVAKLIDNIHNPLNFIMYLTNISFYALTIYLLTSTYLSWRHVRNPQSFVPWEGLHWGLHFPYFLLYQASVLTSIIVFLVYWSLLAKKEFPGLSPTATCLSIAMHACNLLMTSCEVLLSRNTFVFTHVLLYLPITLLYIPYAIIMHAITNKWPYYFLDYHTNPKPFTIVIVGIICSTLVFHSLLVLVHRLRDKSFQPIHESKVVGKSEKKDQFP